MKKVKGPLTAEEILAIILADPATSYRLREWVLMASSYEPVEALIHDAQVLLAYCRLRFDESR